jgi:hypothetical protein
MIALNTNYQVSNRLQNKNNTSGNNGVYLKKDVNKWVANIRINGRLKHLGIFSDTIILKQPV